MRITKTAFAVTALVLGTALSGSAARVRNATDSVHGRQPV